MNGVTINGKHSLDDFGLYLQPKSIPVPASKLNIVAIKGGDGQIDLSTSLTDGNMKYENRKFELSFVAIGFGSDFDENIETFMHSVHGKNVELVFDDDQSHYYVGRCEVKDRDYANGYVTITCEFDCEPYRYEIEPTVINRTVSGNLTLNIVNSRQWVVPTITASDEMALMFQGVLYQVLEGRHVNENIILREGNNTLAFSGNGTVSIEYRQGVL